jgi:drug/metabolite transporter (DMT)-like permease
VLSLAATAAWSTSGIIIAYVTSRFRVPPFALAAWRNLIISFALVGGLCVAARPLLRLERKHVPLFALNGLVLAALSALYPLSVALNGAAVATLLIYIAPVFSAVAARFVLGEPLGPSKIGAVIVGLVGCVLVSGAYDPANWEVNAVGIAVGLGTGVSFAAYGLVGKSVSRRGATAWTTLAYTFLASTLILFLALRADAIVWIADSPLGGQNGWADAVAGWGMLVMLALGPTLGGHGLYVASLAHLPASTATLIVALEPPMTAALAYVLLGERLSGLQVLGGGLVLLAVVGVVLGDRRQRKQKSQDLPPVREGKDRQAPAGGLGTPTG